MSNRIRIDQIQDDIHALLCVHVPERHADFIRNAFRACRRQVASQVLDDLDALASRDAAAHASPSYVYECYAGFHAVRAYRVAHMLHVLGERDIDPIRRRCLRLAARRISEAAKVATGVEIHPAATIGRRLMIDHGSGTVIGEQVVMGDDCYILQNVTLGGRSIAWSAHDKLSPRRHPHIGHRVEIGGGVAVFGPVTIGDDCRLEAGARITTDILPNTRVRLLSTMQATMTDHQFLLFGIAPLPGGLLIAGAGIKELQPAVLDHQHDPIEFLPLRSSGESHLYCGPPDAEVCRHPTYIGLYRAGRLADLILPASSFWKYPWARNRCAVASIGSSQ